MQTEKKKVCVIGLGYIGLPTAALISNLGYEVVGVDINQSIVDSVNSGNVHIVEPDLDKYVQESVLSNKLKAYTKPKESDVYIICVPTPFKYENAIPLPNIDFVIDAAESIKDLIKEGDLIILESTSPVGTTRKIYDLIETSGVDIEKVSIAYCPERVLPGKIIQELINNDRIVGGVNKKSTEIISDFYETFVNGNVLRTSDKTAEMCKLAENSFRDINIAYANELSMICDKNNINVWELIDLANRHPRVDILEPGTGVGGHCIAVDPWFIVSNDPDDSKLIKTAREINDYKPDWVVDKIITEVDRISSSINSKPKVACLGLSFKPNIDDLRGSPAAYVVAKLQDENINVVSVEPNIKKHNKFTLCSFEEALESDLIVFLVKHKEFLSENNIKMITKKNFLDFCGALRS